MKSQFHLGKYELLKQKIRSIPEMALRKFSLWIGTGKKERGPVQSQGNQGRGNCCIT